MLGLSRIYVLGFDHGQVFPKISLRYSSSPSRITGLKVSLNCSQDFTCSPSARLKHWIVARKSTNARIIFVDMLINKYLTIKLNDKMWIHQNNFIMFIRKLMKLYIFHHKFKKTMEILKSIDYVDKHPTGCYYSRI